MEDTGLASSVDCGVHAALRRAPPALVQPSGVEVGCAEEGRVFVQKCMGLTQICLLSECMPSAAELSGVLSTRMAGRKSRERAGCDAVLHGLRPAPAADMGTSVIRENSFQVHSVKKSGGSQLNPNLASVCIHVLLSLFILLHLHLLEFLRPRQGSH